ncbi:YitT family protein [Aliarcobacter butzleri]|uniref:YitT family protein n=1 Tax=Aliarcobacter butzleri TaxID=28197 RepID=UPI0001F0ED26|nr:YitT family protein [Aliarcobacter butzleri]EFU69039.1 brp/Blh family beta-carotene 15,15'-monooxygenase [Aliarcobacter butzleri JV22]MBF7070636.1 YitT family protein [Aliarcobacter butzleri]MCG3651740.1 YitT family protein [Aliarcobacter butzleri]MCG3658770.1 YitT family protein [Aliarcobacter butzleri]MCG3669150.1 YitT family protein [Aliarcobacter butzleri]
MKKINLKHYIFIVLGSLAMAFGTVCFLSPNQIITGGGVGISLLLHALFPQITLGIFMAIVSIPFLIMSYIYFGKYYLFKTFIVVILLSTFTDVLKEVLHIKPMTNDILLAAIFGGIFIGLGVGFVIKGRASTGSTSVVGEIVAKKTKYKAAEVLLAIDATIMFASVFVYNDINKSLYSMISVYVGIRVIDMILTGRPSKKIVNIVSNNVEVLKEQIRERIEEHGTILTGIGLHQGQNKTIIYVTVEASKIDLLKNLITKYDPDAFMIITEASEFLGRGSK